MQSCLRLAARRGTLAARAPLPARSLSRTLSRARSTEVAATKGSLISDTLAEMEADPEFKLTAKKLKEVGQKRLSLEERKRRRRALDAIGVPDFNQFLEERGIREGTIVRDPTTMLQVNVGLYCNQACTHCHVESSPKRKETMSLETVEQIVRLLASSTTVKTVDITGGAPEMNEAFRPLVIGARALDLEVIDRCNLTVLCEPEMEDLPDFLASNGVRIVRAARAHTPATRACGLREDAARPAEARPCRQVASMPCYSAENVNKQRGNKVFERSIEGIRKLNAVGYGIAGSGLKMDLVYNPGGAFLPPPQARLGGGRAPCVCPSKIRPLHTLHTLLRYMRL